MAEGGFATVPATELTTLASWARDWCEATGDGRYCVVAEGLRLLDQWWSRFDEQGGIPTRLAERIDAVMTTWLPAVLDADTPADGALSARTWREELSALLLPPERWPDS